MRPRTVTMPAGGGDVRQFGARRAAGDPAAVDEHDAAVGERERRDDVIAARPSCTLLSIRICRAASNMPVATTGR